jgi:sterol desaturase/sphingolipid hydroxylase (fatty acid hydroxylase superfamily)
MTLAAEVDRTRTPTRALCLPSLAIAAATAALVWFAAHTLERAAVLGSALSAGRAELIAPAVVGLVAMVLVCERLWPAERRAVLARGHVHDAAYFVLHVLLFVPLMTLLGVAFAELLVGHARWLEVGWTASWPRPVLLGVTIVLMDGANWLAHYADHRFSALWRLHALHHSQEELNVLTSFRAHPLSHLLGFFLATIPVVVLVGDKGMAPELITAYICLGTLPHANVNWSFGPVGKVVVSPAYHRIHHSYEGSAGINLAIVLTVWDVLAGRARFPVKGAAPCATGLAGRPFPAEQRSGGRWHLGLLARQLAEPFGVSSA